MLMSNLMAPIIGMIETALGRRCCGNADNHRSGSFLLLSRRWRSKPGGNILWRCVPRQNQAGLHGR
ncbi:hypothetical protein F3P66_06105 [Agrobacterium fabrum]|nr:hypothetical protein F3P66_06105 [Agrobacterium fabrum]TRB26970.1 hypothetical protein EXN51_20990 [Agrobacterium fabrum]